MTYLYKLRDIFEICTSFPNVAPISAVN